jgi:hypothetical protein
MLSLLLSLPAAEADEVLRYYDEVPSTLNPLYADDLADLRAQTLVFDGLFSLPPFA